jgi:hypothetical protein
MFFNLLFLNIYSAVYTKNETFINKKYTEKYTSISYYNKNILVLKRGRCSYLLSLGRQETILPLKTPLFKPEAAARQ